MGSRYPSPTSGTPTFMLYRRNMVENLFSLAQWAVPQQYLICRKVGLPPSYRDRGHDWKGSTILRINHRLPWQSVRSPYLAIINIKHRSGEPLVMSRKIHPSGHYKTKSALIAYALLFPPSSLRTNCWTPRSWQSLKNFSFSNRRTPYWSNRG